MPERMVLLENRREDEKPVRATARLLSGSHVAVSLKLRTEHGHPSVQVPVGRELASSDRLSDLRSDHSGGRAAGLDGEFDPGSGRTLAACLTHASRTRSNPSQDGGRPSGERVSNT